MENIELWLQKLVSQTNHQQILNDIQEKFVASAELFVGYVKSLFVDSYSEKWKTRQVYMQYLLFFVSDMEKALNCKILNDLPLVHSFEALNWQPIYWDFLHFSSFVLQHALATNRIQNVSSFPILTHNIELILPCSICVQGFTIAKKSSRMERITKLISYGATAYGMYLYHSLITEKVHPDAALFTKKDFIRKYSILPIIYGDPILRTFIRLPLLIINELQTNLLIMLQVTYSKQRPLHFVYLYDIMFASPNNKKSEEELQTRDILIKHLAEVDFGTILSSDKLDDESRKAIIDVKMSLESIVKEPRIYPNLETISTIDKI